MEKFFVSRYSFLKEFEMDGENRDTKYLLFMCFALINVAGCVALWIVWKTGWVESIIFTNDSTYICRIILALFVGAVAACSWKLFKITRDLNIAREYIRLYRADDHEGRQRIEAGNSRLAVYLADIKGLSTDDRISFEIDLRENMSHKISSVGNNMSRLTALGIIGTVIGMKLFITGFDAAGATVNPNIHDMLKTVLPGLNVAISATLLGGVAAFWLDWLFAVLESAKNQLVSAMIKAGVYYGKS